jgi:hippurate hydrolase
MLDEGLLSLAGDPPLAAYAAHVYNGRPGTAFTRAGAVLASMAEVQVIVRGRGGHGSAPHLALDPVPVLAEIVTALQAYVTRRHNVFDPIVVSVTRLQAAEAVNVIPDSAVLDATVRTLSAASLDAARPGIADLAGHIARAHGMEAETVWRDLYPVTHNDPAETDRALGTAQRVLGPDAVSRMADPLMGSEDFAKVLARVPGALVFLGATPSDLDPATAPGVHSPRVRFTDDHLHLHAALLADLAITRLATADPTRKDAP